MAWLRGGTFSMTLLPASVVLFGLFGNGSAAPDEPKANDETAGCTITGYRKRYSESRPAYVPGDDRRLAGLGARIRFPTPALRYNETTQRFALSLVDDQNGEEIIEVRRKHVSFTGASCPGKVNYTRSVRCREDLSKTSRASNPIFCTVMRDQSDQ